jgi:ribose transport system ATP-binding protein
MSCILISHLLGEILETSGRIVVMRDGKVVVDGVASQFDRERLIEAMGGAEGHATRVAVSATAANENAPVMVSARPAGQQGGIELRAREGEIVGLAGLAAHGQTRLLIDVFRAASSRQAGVSVAAPVALVAGDRQTDGVFPLWSIAENIAVRSLKSLRRGLFIAADREKEVAQRWQKRIGIRTPDLNNNILSLSGGNQQKALFARILERRPRVLLLDEPTRGVDIGAKADLLELGERLGAGATCGVVALSELAELSSVAHRVVVLREGRVIAELGPDDTAPQTILEACYEHR